MYQCTTKDDTEVLQVECPLCDEQCLSDANDAKTGFRRPTVTKQRNRIWEYWRLLLRGISRRKLDPLTKPAVSGIIKQGVWQVFIGPWCPWSPIYDLVVSF